MRTFNSLSTILVVAALSMACTTKSMNAPTESIHPLPVPDQSQYEPIGVQGVSHRLMDPDGNPSAMSIKFISVNPARGAALIIGASACPANCFTSQAQICMDPGEIPDFRATITVYFSNDGVNPTGFTVSGGVVGPGECTNIGDGRIYFFEYAPMWLIVKGSHFWGVNQPNMKTGTTKFLLDYRAMQ